MKKLITKLILIFVLLLSGGTIISMAQTATAPSGSGTSSDPYRIASLNNLYWIADSNGRWGSYYIQTADIDASSSNTWNNGSGWITIGDDSGDFTGTYDGQGHTISGLYVNRPTRDYVGLFGSITGATIKNLGLINASVTGRQYVGALVGYSYSTTSSISSCFSTGTVSGTNSIGGLIGYSDNPADFMVSNCYSHCSVTCTVITAGGLIGNINNESTMIDCYSSGAVSGPDEIGGLIGTFSGHENMTNCFWDTQTSGLSTSSGSAVGKTTTQMQTATTFSSWSTSVWSLTDGSYPTFLWQLTAPNVTTQAVSDIGSATATGNGTITGLGSPNPTAYGVCWNTTGTPTISDSKVDKGASSVTGAFTASMTSLTANTTYHVRAYATNTAGTSYGDEVSFTTERLTTTYDGSAWSPSTPTSADNAVLNGNYSGAGFSCYNLVVNAGKQVTITSGTLAVGGNLTLKSDATDGTATLVNSGTVTVSGTTSVEQYLTGKTGESTTDNWWYVSSPVTGATSSMFDALTGTNKFGYYNEAANPPAYVQITDNTSALTPGAGYVVKIGGDAGSSATYTYSGTLNDGNMPITVTRTGTTAVKRGFNLIGNPYPSYLNWNALKAAATTSSNVRPTIWYRTRTSSGVMTFDTFDGTTGTGNGVNGTVSQYIPPMQAFWMKVDADASSATLTFSNSMRSHQDQSSATNRLRSSHASDLQIVRLKVSNGVNTDEAIILADSKAADTLDYYDSQKMSNENVNIPEIYTLAGTEELVINHLNSISESKELVLGFRSGIASKFTIEATQISNLDSNLKVMLLDKQTNAEQELTVGSPYSFSSDAIATNDRFSLQFKSFSTELNNAASNSDIIVYSNQNNKIMVICNSNTSSTFFVTVYNAVGQRQVEQNLTGSVTEIDNIFVPGIYLVTVNNGEQNVVKKISIN